MSEARTLLEEVQEERRPGIRDDWQADKVIQSIQRIDAEKEEQIQHHLHQIEIIRERAARRKAFFEPLLDAYLDSVPASTAKTQISYKLNSGQLVRKFAYQKAEIVDEQAVVEYLEQNGADELVKIKKAANWAELKKRGKFEGSMFVDAQTAEVIPGVEVTTKPETFKVVCKP